MYIHINFLDGSNPYIKYFESKEEKQKELAKWQKNFVLHFDTKTACGWHFIAEEKQQTPSIKVNYQLSYGQDGTAYRQQIKIKKIFLDGFNNFVDELKEGCAITNDYERYYLSKIDTSKKYAFLNLTTAKYLKLFLASECNIDVKRFLKDRNTMLILL